MLSIFLQNTGHMFDYSSGLVWSFDFSLSSHEGAVVDEITEDADFEIIESKKLPNATTDNR